MTDNEAVAILDYLQFALIKHVGERIERITDDDNIVGHLYDGIYAALNDVDTTLDMYFLLQEQEAAAKRTR
jgi:hypothetical protein